MELSSEDKCRIWRALASYIEESKQIAELAHKEIEAAKALQQKFNGHQYNVSKNK